MTKNEKKPWDGHTPGPWEIEGHYPDGEWDIRNITWDVIVREIQGEGATWMGNEADAALIAAAPDLAARVEKLEADIGIAHVLLSASAGEENERLKAEVHRLRSALETLRDGEGCPEGINDAFIWVSETASAALDQKGAAK